MKTLYFDGYSNSRNAGFVVTDSIGNVISESGIGKKTNNEAEYYGALKALELVDHNGTVYTDSKLVEGQVMFNWKVKAFHLRSLVQGCRSLVKRKNVNLVWLRRNKNLAGIVIEQGMVIPEVKPEVVDELLNEYNNMEF